jgi:hypothetical protein
MDTNALKKFAQAARNLLIDQVTARLDLALAEGGAARRAHPKAVNKLEVACAANRKQVIEQAAYAWFNRFTALRFMDATGLTNPRVVSPADGATRPEILAEALAGYLPDGARPEIAEYLNGTRPAHDAQAEAYRLLLIHACNQWHVTMPFMFEAAEDYSELLMPDDLLSPDSILARLREVMTEDACQDVEIIGWLYQFYISEKKDQVFAGLKKNQKITAENIPAATQLFTPHWIVRYLVENSLGRLWLLNRPSSKLAERMDYYIAPEEPETDFLKITKPEEIRICDPAAGSGHMLTYAFDLLYAIYEEEGYDATEIPALILTHNLTGVEIDDRAGALAAFALAMKAAAKLGRRRFLRMEAKPDICVLQNVTFTPAEMQDVAAVVGKDLFTDELRETLRQFEQAKNFGALIVPKLRDPAATLRVVEARDFGGDLLLKEVQERVISVLCMAEALSPKYHVVVANPPYMGGKNMNEQLSGWLKTNYFDFKLDLYSSFIVRCCGIATGNGYVGIMSPHTWMYISSHEKLRIYIAEKCSLAALVELPLTGFSGATVQIAAFTMKTRTSESINATFINLTTFKGGDPAMRDRTLDAVKDPSLPYVHRERVENFEKIPGTPIAYASGPELRKTFSFQKNIGQIARPRVGANTTNNDLFLRFWPEISQSKTCFFAESEAHAESTGMKWFPYNKGGPFRKWSGNFFHVVNFENNGKTICDYIDNSGARVGSSGRIINREFYFKPGITWSDIKTGGFGARLTPKGFVFDVKGSSAFPSPEDRPSLLGLMSSKLTTRYIDVLNPTVTIQVGDIARIPFKQVTVAHIVNELCDLSKSDWDAYETSWDFTTLPLLSPDHRGATLEDSYATLRAHWQSMTNEMKALEEENNGIFIDAYGLQDELTPEVPIEEITLTCNPAYRYGVKASVEELDTRLRADTIAEFLHYAVGCMLGRYSLDAPGLILANQGETLADYLARIPEPSFMPDEDNVIPVLDGDWFADDIVARARDFIRITFGDAKFRENLDFVEDALGKDLRKWFTRDFFDYHVRRYKKRPIYWMFSSPKGSFNALIYMHRYRPDTVSVVLNQYLRDYIGKLENERARLDKLSDDPTATPSQRTKALKDVGAVIKQIEELTAWERDVVYPMAQAKIAIDLDDGVKRNYPLFNGALKPIKGLEAADD